MKVYTIPCHERGHINVMLVLQSCSESLQILPGSSNETSATSDDVCSFSNIEVEGYAGVIEEDFKVLHEEVDVGVKQEEIPGDATFPDIMCEPDKVSYVCICLLLDTFYQCPGIPVFLCHYFWPIETALLLGVKLFCCFFFTPAVCIWECLYQTVWSA
jgi:hypothetical protein